VLVAPTSEEGALRDILRFHEECHEVPRPPWCLRVAGRAVAIVAAGALFLGARRLNSR